MNIENRSSSLHHFFLLLIAEKPQYFHLQNGQQDIALKTERHEQTIESGFGLAACNHCLILCLLLFSSIQEEVVCASEMRSSSPQIPNTPVQQYPLLLPGGSLVSKADVEGSISCCEVASHMPEKPWPPQAAFHPLVGGGWPQGHVLSSAHAGVVGLPQSSGKRVSSTP